MQRQLPPAPHVSAGKAAATRRRTAVVLTLRIVLALVFTLPLIFMFVSSLKPDLQIFKDLGSWRAFAPIGHISFDNYLGVFD